MELNQDLEPLPEDSTVIVRSRSALGLKYLEVQRGDVRGGLRGRRHDPAVSAATPEPVEIDEVFNTFDDPTRAAIQVEPDRVRERARRPRRRPERRDRRPAARWSSGWSR